MKSLPPPLYVQSHDLTRWILERVLDWPANVRSVIGDPLAQEARRLVQSISLGLTFIHQRPEHVRAADESIVRLRELLRLARDLGFLPASSHRYAQGELLEIGRMVGGWRKRWRGSASGNRKTIHEEVGQGLRRQVGSQPPSARPCPLVLVGVTPPRVSTESPGGHPLLWRAP